MGSIASIPLQIQTPQILNPTQLAQQKLTLQQLANSNMIQRQVQQENALKLQAQQEDQNDQETFQSALKNNTKIDPATGAPKTDWDSALAEASPNMRIRNVQAIQNDHLALLKNAIAATQAQRDQYSASNQVIGQKLAQIYQTPVEGRLPVYQQARQDLISQGYIKPDDPKYPEVPPDLSDKTLEAEIQGVGYMSNLLDQAKSRAATAAQTQKTQQEATVAQRGLAMQDYRALPVNPATGVPDPNSVAALQKKYPAVELPVDKLGRDAFILSSVPVGEATKVQFEQNLLSNLGVGGSPSGGTGGSGFGQNAINGVATDPAIRQIGYGRLAGVKDFDSFQKAINDTAADQVRKNMDTDPDINRNKIAVAAAEGASRAATENKYNELTKAQGEYIQSKADLSTSLALADEVKTLATRAANNDPVAAKQLPQAMALYAGSLYGVKRQPNGQIMEPPGSWGDKIQGWANEATKGVPYSSDILADIPSTIDAMSKTATQIHNAKTATTNDVRGTNFKLEPTAPVITAAPPLPAKLQPADKGKIFTSPKTGQKIKITDINPSDPTQFKSQPAQ